MKISFTTMATPDLDHTGAIALAREFSLDGVDPRCSDNKGEIRPDSSAAELEGVAADFRAAGLAIPGLLCYCGLSAEPPEGWARTKANIAHHLAIGAAIGAETVRLFGGHWGDDAREGFLDAAARTIREVLDADDSGVSFTFQNHRGSLNARDAAELAGRVNSDRFGLAFSPDHCTAMGEEDFDGILDAVGPWTKEIYIADGTETGLCLPGEGIVPLAETISFFEDRAYAGFYTFKYEKLWVPDLPDAREALPQFVEFIRSAATA